MSEPKTLETVVESRTKKCNCGRPAIGVIKYPLLHSYCCRKCARKLEKEGLTIDYNNWRL